jgi:hypothetical protein
MYVFGVWCLGKHRGMEKDEDTELILDFSVWGNTETLRRMRTQS